METKENEQNNLIIETGEIFKKYERIVKLKKAFFDKKSQKTICTECVNHEMWDCEGQLENVSSYVNMDEVGVKKKTPSDKAIVKRVISDILTKQEVHEFFYKTNEIQSNVEELGKNIPKFDKSYTFSTNRYFTIDIDFIKKLIILGKITPNQTNLEGESILLFASSIDNEEIAEILLEKGGDVNYAGNNSKNTPLLEACRKGHEKVLKVFLDYGANTDAWDENGNTGLHLACSEGHTEIIKLLVAAGARLDLLNERSHNPLMEAVSGGHIDAANLLIKSNPDLLEMGLKDETDTAKDTPDPSPVSCDVHETPLTIACYKGNLELVKVLLDEGKEYGFRRDELYASLMEASMDGHIEIVKLLLNYGADLNYPENSLETPLTLACNGGHYELVKILLERGANVESSNEEGFTALMEASREGYLNIVKLLLSYKPDANTMTEDTHETALTLASSSGCYDIVVELVKYGADTEIGSPTPLIEASSLGYFEIAKHLIDSGANVNTPTSFSDTALIAACEHGNIEIVRLLIEKGAEVDHCTSSGISAIMKAARAGHYEIVELLLKYNVDVNRQSHDNDVTVLSCACIGGHFNVVKLLLQHGADPLHILKDNVSILMEASRGGFVSVAMLLMEPSLIWTDVDSTNIKLNQDISFITNPQASNLSKNKVDADITPKSSTAESLKNRSVSSLSSDRSNIPSPKSRKKGPNSTTTDSRLQAKIISGIGNSQEHHNMTHALSTIKHLKSQAKHAKKALKSHQSPLSKFKKGLSGTKEIDINSYSIISRESALTIACTSGHYEMAVFLIKKGASIEHRDRRGYTPLMICAYNGCAKICSYLLDIGANIEAYCEKSRETALTLSCATGRYEIIKILLDKGANIEHRTLADYTALTIASNHGQMAIINLLLEHGADVNPHLSLKHGVTPLMLASMAGHTQVVRLLLSRGADPTIEGNKSTALGLACIQGKTEIVQLLLGRKINTEHRTKNGLTPLMEAANGSHEEIVALLLENGADVNPQPTTNVKESPLTIAAEKGNVKIVTLLLEKGASVDFKNKKGCTPLWLAASNGHCQVVEMLANYNARLDVTDGRDVSALVVAFRSGHQEVVNYLVHRVSRFPSENDCRKFINNLNDKNIHSSVILCYEIIMKEKAKQDVEADKRAIDLLNELDKEKKNEKKTTQQPKKNEKKRKKKTKQASEAPASSKPDSKDDTANSSKVDSGAATPKHQAAVQQKAQNENTNQPSRSKGLKHHNRSETIASRRVSPDPSVSDSEEWKQVSRKSASVKIENTRKAVRTQIPSHLVSRFIGKGGSSINLIREATNTSVEIDTTKKTPTGDCTIIIKGLNKDIKNVLFILSAIINEPERSTQSTINELESIKKSILPAPHTVLNSKDMRNYSVTVSSTSTVFMNPAKTAITTQSMFTSPHSNISFGMTDKTHTECNDVEKSEKAVPNLVFTSPKLPLKKETLTTTNKEIIHQNYPIPKKQNIYSENYWGIDTESHDNESYSHHSSKTLTEGLTAASYNANYPALTQSDSQRAVSFSYPPKQVFAKLPSLCPGADRPASNTADHEKYVCPFYDLVCNGKYEVGIQFDKKAWNSTSFANKPSIDFVNKVVANIDLEQSSMKSDTNTEAACRDSLFARTPRTYSYPSHNDAQLGYSKLAKNTSAPLWLDSDDSNMESSSYYNDYEDNSKKKQSD